MMPCMPSSGGHAAPLLISLAFGYAVLVLANRETSPLNRLGKSIGWLIMAVSLIGLLCSAATGLCRLCPSHRMACGRSMPGCMMGGHRAEGVAPDKMAQDEDKDDDKPGSVAPIDKK